MHFLLRSERVKRAEHQNCSMSDAYMAVKCGEETEENRTLNIFLACYLKNDLDFNIRKNNIENTMTHYFQDHVEFYTEERVNAKDVVLVFKIQKPIIQDHHSIVQFFQNLETVFSVLSENSPHFTQEQYYHSSLGGENS